MRKSDLQYALAKATNGCTIQHKGFPCNTCFHALDLTLTHELHDYWLAVLAYRGDYPELPKHPDLIAELYKALEV